MKERVEEILLEASEEETQSRREFLVNTIHCSGRDEERQTAVSKFVKIVSNTFGANGS
jgi:hypothetical protein